MAAPPRPRFSSLTNAPSRREPSPPPRLAAGRVRVLFVMMSLIFAIILVRLADVQVRQHEDLRAQAQREFTATRVLQPIRGVITDRRGNVLAMDVDRESLYVIPRLIDLESAPRLATILGAILDKPASEILAIMLRTDGYQYRLDRWLRPEIAEQIAALQEPGLSLEYEPLRVYPQADFAGQILGGVNHNGDGISGVEAFFNSTLKGITGTLSAEFARSGAPIAIASQARIPAQNGSDLQLTIDPLIQHIAEEALADMVQAQSADGGTVIVMEAETGAIRAMASWPLFDPNKFNTYPPEIYSNNPAVNALYEPGSTMKMFVVAMGLEAGAFTAETSVPDPGSVVRYGQPLRNFDGGGNGPVTPGDVLYYSSNVGALQFAELIGPERFYQGLARFGFGLPTGIELGGEQSGIINAFNTPNYNDLTFLTNAYGQGVSVTPLQLVQAASAIANDGVMMRPYVVAQRCSAGQAGEAGECVATEPASAGQPISAETARAVREMLVNSANHYAPVVWGPQSGNYQDQWMVPGYRVGAKTGTSSIPLPTGGYDPTYTIGSVLGFAPADNPKYVVLVKVDRPKQDQFAVLTTIPGFYTVVDQLMRLERIPPDPALFSPGQS